MPDDIVQALGSGKRPAVLVTVADHSYRTTIAAMGGRFLVPLSAEHRSAAGLAAGDRVSVTIEADTAPRDVAVPNDLAQALADDPAASQFFDALAYSYRKEWARWIDDAKRHQKPAPTASRKLSTPSGPGSEPVSAGHGRPYFTSDSVAARFGNPTTVIEAERVTHLVFPVRA